MTGRRGWRRFVRNESLPTHGAGPLYAVRLGRLRLSLGGYGWIPRPVGCRGFYVQRWRGVAVHVHAGPFSVSWLSERVR